MAAHCIARQFREQLPRHPEIGDSSQPNDPLDVSRDQLEQRDIADALSLMQHEGVGELIVAGLCSGADNSLVAIAGNERVTGAVLLDPFVFKTRRYYVEHYGRRIGRPASWWNVATGRSPLLKQLARSIFPSRSEPEPVIDELLGAVPEPTHGEYEERLQALIAREARLLFVFTGGLEERYNYRNQLFDAFPRLDLRGGTDLEYLPDSDHTFSREACKEQIESIIVAWCASHYGDAAVQ